MSAEENNAVMRRFFDAVGDVDRRAARLSSAAVIQRHDRWDGGRLAPAGR